MRDFTARISGATAIEYGLIAGLIAMAILASLQVLGGQMAALYTSIVAALP